MIHSVLKLYSTVWLFLLYVQGAHASRSKRFIFSQPTTQTIDTGPYHWSQWSSWSSCNGTCHIHGGLGQQSRTRYCDDGSNAVKLGHCRKPYTHHSGDDGDDDDVSLFRRDTQERDDVVLDDGPKSPHSSHQTMHDYQSCVAPNCPVKGGWSLWGNYSSCSVPSGHGHMTRYRLCNNPTPVHGGHDCIGSSSETKPCTVDIWSTWGSWIPCSVSCGTGGIRLRSRHCTTGSDCVGSTSDSETCMEIPCARNGGWGDWTEFAECSTSCGNGVTFRTRQCNKPFPENGGLNCTGSSQEFKTCKRTCPLDGGWSNWTEFAECSLSCGNGVTFRTRQCNNPFPENGGLNCTGSSQEFKTCKRTCPIDGGWSNWTEFAECSLSCGNGVSFRTRQCNNPFPENGGVNCTGSSQEFKACNRPCPKDGGWTSFQDMSCSATCGTGVMTSFRTCTNPAPENGGQTCTGHAYTFKRCKPRDCTGFWSTWSTWSNCSNTCGNGTQTRTRLCSNPQNGGLKCPGSETESTTCNMGPCPIDGGWSEYRNSSCSSTCGKGTILSYRACNNPVPQYGGKDCVGLVHQVHECKLAPCKIDGSWGSWSNWTECSISCGNGTEIRTRQCDSPYPQYGGQNCTGKDIETQNCLIKECSIDGSWGSWSNWTECSISCGNGTEIRTRQCDSPSPQYGGKNCTGKDIETQNCLIKECSIDGSWGSWSNWTECSISCGNGTEIRTRQCDSPSPQYGGKNCTGKDIETQNCLIKECSIDGSWGSWSNRTECSISCGNGTEIRTRQCDSPSPQYGGKNCTGKDIETQNCLIKECSIDGNWSEWSVTGKCEPLCGDGYAIRYRTCSNPTPENGGHNCTGNPEERIACNSGPCSADVPICVKTTVMETLKTHALFAPTRAGPCSNMDYIPEENMLEDLCGAPSDTNMWGINKDVRANCETIPLYSPIVKVHRLYKIKNYGILLDCYQSQLKLATETCEDGVHEQDISLDIVDDWDYFTMTW